MGEGTGAIASAGTGAGAVPSLVKFLMICLVRLKALYGHAKYLRLTVICLLGCCYRLSFTVLTGMIWSLDVISI